MLSQWFFVYTSKCSCSFPEHYVVNAHCHLVKDNFSSCKAQPQKVRIKLVLINSLSSYLMSNYYVQGLFKGIYMNKIKSLPSGVYIL